MNTSFTNTNVALFCTGSGDLNGRPPPCGDPFIETQGNDGDSTYFQPTYECEPEVLQAGSMLTTDLTVYGHHGGFGRCAINVNRYAEEWNEADFIQLITCDLCNFSNSFVAVMCNTLH